MVSPRGALRLTGIVLGSGEGRESQAKAEEELRLSERTRVKKEEPLTRRDIDVVEGVHPVVVSE